MLWLKLASIYLILVLVKASPYVDRKSSQQRNDLSFVHTFDTKDTCMERCRLQCTQQHSEDLMMPRWLCALQDDSGAMILDTEEDGGGWSFSTNALLFSIPAVIFIFLFFLFVCVSCVQKFFRGI